MKKNISIVTLMCGLALLIAGGLILSSCEGPAGPAGPAGVAGDAGDAGPAGPAGADGNGTCVVCHNSDVVLLAKQQQTMSSHHLMGGNYERNSASCAQCHTHQGFVEYQATGDVAGSITDPAPINCRTCHMIHESYLVDDWTLVNESAVVLDFGGETIDLGGASNLCINCHQFRAVNPMPVVGGDSVDITSSRYGPHHGPHSNNLWGIGGYLVAGSETYPEAGSHAHANAGCVSCHMAPVPYGGRSSGGHTFNMTYEYHGHEEGNIGACTTCHADAEDFDIGGVQTTIEGLVTDLETIFIANGWMDAPGALWNASSSAPLRVSADEAGAMLNYKIITEDRSKGVHNPAYMVALLTNSLASLQ